MSAELLILTTGGTIDKVYFDDKSDYQVGNPQITDILQHVGVSIPYVVKTLLAKDSLELTEQDRNWIRDEVHQATQRCILITHGTDTMVTTARHIQPVRDKTVVLVGALMPARFKSSDAEFNIGFALAAAQILPDGVYLAMNGRIFNPEEVQKNIAANRFEPVQYTLGADS